MVAGLGRARRAAVLTRGFRLGLALVGYALGEHLLAKRRAGLHGSAVIETLVAERVRRELALTGTGRLVVIAEFRCASRHRRRGDLSAVVCAQPLFLAGVKDRLAVAFALGDAAVFGTASSRSTSGRGSDKQPKSE